MALPGRQFNSANYRYGFNDKENDNEVKGTGNSVDFGARMYDPRLCRWLSIDPVKHPFESPYAGMSNSPILFIDQDGCDIKPGNRDAVAQLGDVFKSFDTKINDRSVNGVNLFGVQGRNVGFEGAPQQLVLGTILSNREFNRNLNRSGLSQEQKQQAKSIFKILSSNDTYEVGTVESTSKLNNGNNGQPNPNNGNLPNANQKLVTENTDAINLLNQTTEGNLSNPQIKNKLLEQENSGTTKSGGTFGVFNDLIRPQSPNEKSVKGIILINPPQNVQGVRAGTGNASSGTSNETKGITESLNKASEKIQN